MAGSFDEVVGKRYLKRYNGENYYVFVSDKGCMITIPDENKRQNESERSALTAHCRLISMAINHGAKLKDAAYQLRASCLSPTTPTAMLAGVIEEYLEGDNNGA